MFNNNLKKEALKIHEKTLAEYNASYGIMGKSGKLNISDSEKEKQQKKKTTRHSIYR